MGRTVHRDAVLIPVEFVVVLERRRRLGRRGVDLVGREVARQLAQGRGIPWEEKQMVARRLARVVAV